MVDDGRTRRESAKRGSRRWESEEGRRVEARIVGTEAAAANSIGIAEAGETDLTLTWTFF